MWDDYDRDALKITMRKLFAELGIARALVTFSGGNDSGGADHIEVVYHDGRGEKVAPEWLNLPWTPGQTTEQLQAAEAAYRSGLSPLQQLAMILTDLPSWEYGSFAGEFDVNGTIIVTPEDNVSVKVRVEQSYREYLDDPERDGVEW